MDWSGAKNWLIALFAALNIFLIIMLVNISMHSARLEKQVIEDTVTILAGNGISVDSEIIPDSIPKLNSVEVSNAIADKDAFAALILGEGYKKTDSQYILGTKSLHFSQSKFYYTNQAPSESYTDLSDGNAAVKVSAFLSNLGFGIETAEYKTSHKNGVFTVELSQKLDKYPLFDSSLKVVVLNEGIASVEGSWFYVSDDQSNVKTTATRVCPSTAALIDFISDEKRAANSSDKITEISIGYTAGETAEYQAFAAAVPVWRIKTSDGHYYYFDAR